MYSRARHHRQTKILGMDKTRETPRARRPQITRYLLRNCPGLLYLAWVAVTSVTVIHSLTASGRPDAGTAEGLIFFQSLPWSLLALVVPESIGLAVFVVVLIAGALVNAAVLNWLCRDAARLTRRAVEHVRRTSTILA